MSNDNESTFRRFVKAVNEHDLDALDALMTPGFTRHCRATAPLIIESLEDFKAFLRQDRAVFPDGHIETKMLLADGDKIAVYMMLTGTQQGDIGPFPPSGKKIDLPFLSILRFESGRIAEMWIEWDNLNVLASLGHVSLSPT